MCAETHMQALGLGSLSDAVLWQMCGTSVSFTHKQNGANSALW